jgi:hypothetical protein
MAFQIIIISIESLTRINNNPISNSPMKIDKLMSTFRSYIYSAFEDYLRSEKDEQEKIKLFEPKIAPSSYNIKMKANAIYSQPNHIIDLMFWPPNVYIILAGLLEKKGGYRLLISGINGVHWKKQDVKDARKIAESWNHILSTSISNVKQNRTDEIVQALQTVFSYQNLQSAVTDLIADEKFILEVLRLIVAADEAFAPDLFKKAKKGSLFRLVLEQIKVTQGATDYQLSFADKHVGAVHVKSTVCQSGVSLNSITHNMAFIKPEINLKIIDRDEGPIVKDVLNILILPWPLNVPRESFTPINNGHHMLEMENDFGFFSYEPHEKIEVGDILTTIHEANEVMGSIDLVVLPECALEQKLAQELADKLIIDSKERGYNCPAFISGTYEVSNGAYGRNQLTMFVPPDTENEEIERAEPDILVQNKHHRWFLDRPQLFNYKLGSLLSPARKWWEFIDVSDRSLITYKCHQQSVQISPLICEDLARQDPVAPAVRALGPTLIVALLLDGAQLKNRWPGRYASFLSEDPGSSVLTVSPLGMTLRSDGTGFPPSRGVAFWSEPGDYRELSLENDKKAIVLTLEKRSLRQWTADGRRHERVSLHYAGNICL